MARRGMKLYVWEGCFADYTDGLAVVLARNVLEARAILRANDEVGSSEDVDNVDPKEYPLTEPMAFAVYGGG